MSFPAKGGYAYRVLQSIAASPKTIAQLLAAAPGRNGTYYTHQAVERLTFNCMISFKSDVFVLTQKGADHIDVEPTAEYIGQVATPRSVNLMQRPAMTENDANCRGYARANNLPRYKISNTGVSQIDIGHEVAK